MAKPLMLMRPPEVVTETEFQFVRWPAIEMLIQNILLLENPTKPVPGLTKSVYEELLRSVFKCSIYGFGKAICVRVTEMMQSRCAFVAASICGHGSGSANLLSDFQKYSELYFSCLDIICPLLAHVDRNYLEVNKLGSMRHIGSTLFVDVVVRPLLPDLLSTLTAHASNPIHVDTSTIKACVECLVLVFPESRAHAPNLFSLYAPTKTDNDMEIESAWTAVSSIPGFSKKRLRGEDGCEFGEASVKRVRE